MVDWFKKVHIYFKKIHMYEFVLMSIAFTSCFLLVGDSILLLFCGQTIIACAYMNSWQLEKKAKSNDVKK